MTDDYDLSTPMEHRQAVPFAVPAVLLEDMDLETVCMIVQTQMLLYINFGFALPSA